MPVRQRKSLPLIIVYSHRRKKAMIEKPEQEPVRLSQEWMAAWQQRDKDFL